MLTSCPNCNTTVEFVDDSAVCPGCGKLLLADAGPLVASHQRARSGLFMVLVGAVLLCFMLIVGVTAFALLWDRPSAVASKPGAPSDPWPECAAIREWLKQNTGDPTSVEIVDWGQRPEAADSDKQGGIYGPIVAGERRFLVNWRGKNQFGALAVERRCFVVRNGKVAFSFPF